MGAALGHPFGSSETAEAVTSGLDLTGLVAIVTGANTGLGEETARVLYLRGAHVIMASRDAERNRAARERIEASAATPDGETNQCGRVQCMKLDLGSLRSVRDFVDGFHALELPLHTLVLNAGVMAPLPKATTKDGFEAQWGVNHLAHFLLAYLLLPLLEHSARQSGFMSRVVFLSSRAHDAGTISFDDPNWEKRVYKPYKAYGQSKLANLLTAFEMNRRLREAGKHVLAVSVHPGVIQSELTRYNNRMQLVYNLMSPVLKTVPQGAATTLYAAVCPEVEIDQLGGRYLVDCKPYPPSIPEATDVNVARRLWDLSCEQVEVDPSLAHMDQPVPKL